MKVVINACYGGYGISDEALALLGLEDDWDLDRDDSRLISLIEEKGSEFCSGFCAKLQVVEIPDTATDWEITEYDGSESIIYVVDGKIHHI